MWGLEVCAHGYPPPTCAPPATECGEGLIGIPDGELTPAPVGAGPREQGGLRLRMSPPPPATCGSCVPGCVCPAPADAGAALVTCSFQSVTAGRRGRDGTSPAILNGEVSQLRGILTAGCPPPFCFPSCACKMATRLHAPLGGGGVAFLGPGSGRKPAAPIIILPSPRLWPSGAVRSRVVAVGVGLESLLG